MPSFADKLRKLRDAAQLTQAELARRAGLHPMQISKYERGIDVPKFTTVCALANALGVVVSAFIPAPERTGKSRKSP